MQVRFRIMTRRAEINIIIETWAQIGQKYGAFLQALEPNFPITELAGRLAEQGLEEEKRWALYSALQKYRKFHPTQPYLSQLASFADSFPLPHNPQEPGMGPGLAAFITEGFRRTGPEETK